MKKSLLDGNHLHIVCLFESKESKRSCEVETVQMKEMISNAEL